MAKEEIVDWRGLNLQSCDILLCEGFSSMSKKIQRFQALTGAKGQSAKISHAAEIYKGHLGYLHVEESTTLNKWADKSGVQMNNFEEWLHNYDGKVWAKQLDFVRDEKFTTADWNFWNAHEEDPYENGIAGNLELVLCGLRLERFVRLIWKSYKPLRTKNPHCTEFAAIRLIKHELLSIALDVNRLPPWMWWSEIDDYFRVPVAKPVRIK